MLRNPIFLEFFRGGKGVQMVLPAFKVTDFTSSPATELLNMFKICNKYSVVPLLPYIWSL